MPVVTAGAMPALLARREVHEAGKVAVVREERTRPVAAGVACTAAIVVVAKARRRKKYGITVLFTCYFASSYPVLSGPCPGAV